MTDGFTVWFSGKPDSGKTTLSRLIHEEILKRGFKAEIIDENIFYIESGDEFDGFKQDLDAKAAMIACISALLNRNDIVSIAPVVPPSPETRRSIREMLENMVEIRLVTPDEAKIPDEESEDAELILETGGKTPDQSAAEVITLLEELTYIEPVQEDYTEEEKREIDERLKSLGYM